jgi:hypothetical protein
LDWGACMTSGHKINKISKFTVLLFRPFLVLVLVDPVSCFTFFSEFIL